MTGSLNLGRIAGIPVRAHWSMALVAAWFGVNLTLMLGPITGILATIAFFLSILAHEFGHALVARRHEVETESIELWVLGGVARLDREAPTPRADGLIALAGPAVSLAIALGSFGLAVLFTSPLFGWIALVNGILAVFNMLPGAPLDGGRVLRAWRWSRTGDKYRAARDAGNAGRVLGWGMVGVGVALLFNGYPGIFLAVTGLFIALAARAEIGASIIGEQLRGVTVGDLTWFGIAHAGSDMDADSMIWQRQRLGDAGVVAVEGADGTLDGLVLEEQLYDVPIDRRPMTMLTQLMVPLHKLPKASPDDELAAVLPRVNPLRPVVTVWRGDDLLGVVPPARLRDRLTQLQRTMSPA